MTQLDPIKRSTVNVSSLIRDIHKHRPAATNAEIKLVLLETEGIEAGSNLIQTIGSESERLPLMQKRAEIMPLAERFLQACDGKQT